MERPTPEVKPEHPAEVLLETVFSNNRDLINMYNALDNPLVRYKLFLKRVLTSEEAGLPGCYYDSDGTPRVDREIAAENGVFFFDPPENEE